MPSLLLVRHGQASFGGDDYDVLSDLGRQQARHLARRLSRSSVPARLVEGTLVRQRDTSSVLADVLAITGRDVDPRWNEYNHEELLAVAAEDPDLRDEFERLADPGADRARAFQHVLEVALRRWARGADGAYSESWRSFVERCWSACDELLDDLGSGESALVVTSGGVISAVCAAVLGLEGEQWLALNRVMVNTSITRVVRGRAGTSVVNINDHAHLELEDGMISYR